MDGTGGVMLSEISHTYHMVYSYVDPEKLNRTPWGRGRKKKEVRVGESQSIRDC